MRDWIVYGDVTGEKYLGVFRAETRAEAEELALASEQDVRCERCDCCQFDLQITSAKATPA